MARKKQKQPEIFKTLSLTECSSCGELVKLSSTKQEIFICKACKSFQKRTELKKQCIDYKGGKCFKCGYNACDAAMCFHHFIDYSDGFFSEEEKKKYKKKYSIGSKMHLTFKNLKNELDKCVVLCVRCHSEIHAKLWSLKRSDLDI